MARRWEEGRAASDQKHIWKSCKDGQGGYYLDQRCLWLGPTQTRCRTDPPHKDTNHRDAHLIAANWIQNGNENIFYLNVDFIATSTAALPLPANKSCHQLEAMSSLPSFPHC